MFGFGKSSSAKRLDALAEEIRLACANNYKDVAKDAYRVYQAGLAEELSRGNLKEKERIHFTELEENYREVFRTYHH